MSRLPGLALFSALLVAAVLPAAPPPEPITTTFQHHGGAASWAFHGFRYLEVEKSPVPLESITVDGIVFGWAEVFYTANFADGVDESHFAIQYWDHGAAIFDPTKDIPLTFTGGLEYHLDDLEAGGGLVFGGYSHSLADYGHGMVNHITDPTDQEWNRMPHKSVGRFTIVDPAVLESMELQPGEPLGATATWQVRDGGYYSLGWMLDDETTPAVEGWSQYFLASRRHCRLAITLNPEAQ